MGPHTDGYAPLKIVRGVSKKQMELTKPCVLVVGKATMGART